MELDIDIGNSFLKWRCRDGAVLVARGEVATQSLAGSLFSELSGFALKKVRIGSVASADVDTEVARQLKDGFAIEPVFARTQAHGAGVVNSYAEPERMGVDRWLAMVAAYQVSGGACCVVDCGSAITVDWVSAQGVHQGGYIIPGLNLMQDALFNRTAKVKRRDAVVTAIEPGINTESAVQNGAAYVLAALGERVARECEVNGARLFICGGDGALFAELIEHVECLQPDLVLDGLQWVCEG